MEMLMELDAGQAWRVGYWNWRGAFEDNPGQRYYDHKVVEADTVEIVDGALIFRDDNERLIGSYGPTGWDHIERVR